MTIKPNKNLDRSSVLAIIPAYQEAGQVGKVVSAVIAQGVPVLVIDDGSSDATAANAERAGATVLRHERNMGKGVSLQTGFTWGLKRDYQAFLTMDADGQHDPIEVPHFLHCFAEKQSDLLIGARNFDEMPWTRYTTNTLGRWTLTWLLGEEMHDNQSGYRMLSRRMAKASFESHEKGYEFEVDMIVICKQRGYRLNWIPIRTIYNGERSHINHVQHVYNYARLLWRVRQQMQATEKQ